MKLEIELDVSSKRTMDVRYYLQNYFVKELMD